MTHRNTEQPKNSITLMNGEALECFPKQSPKTKFASDKMQLNTTEAYLDILVSDKNSILPKKIGLIPFAGVSPFWLF